MLHDAFFSKNSEPKPSTSSINVSQEELSETLLATALVKVQTADGSYITLRALIDQGSQTSLITENAAQMLRLPRERCKGVIFGVGARGNNCKGVLNIKCAAVRGNYTFHTEVYIMRHLINNLPNSTFKKPSWFDLKNISLADPDFYTSRPVDILLGADIYSDIIQEGIIKQGKTQPVAQQTRLGWILCGNVQQFQCNVIINNIEDIQRFWTMEDIAENTNMSEDDHQCVEYYTNTTKRQDNGQYIVNIPFTPGFEEKLGASKPMAVAQFHQLERKFKRQHNLAQAYKEFMKEYKS